jgi:hypothetical protein
MFSTTKSQRIYAITVKALHTRIIYGIVQLGPSLSPPQGRQLTKWDKRTASIGTSSREIERGQTGGANN